MENGLESAKEEVKVANQCLNSSVCDYKHVSSPHCAVLSTGVDLQPGRRHCPTRHPRSINCSLSGLLPTSVSPVLSLVRSRGRDIVKDFPEKRGNNNNVNYFLAHIYSLLF